MKMHIQEVVKFKVKEAFIADYQTILSSRNQAIAQFPGFIRGLTFQSADDPSIFVDQIEWSNLESAREAAAASMQMEAFVPFMQSIEKVEFFDHFNVVSQF